jgi:hypothetical protein
MVLGGGKRTGKTLDTSKTVSTTLDNLIMEVNSNFFILLCAISLYQTGQHNVDQFTDDATISPKVGRNVQIEPIPVRSLKQFEEGLPKFFIEVSHSRLVRLWNECLSDLYKDIIELHFAGIKKCSTLNKQRVYFDFNYTGAIEDHLKDGLLHQFGLKEFVEKQKMVNRELNPGKKRQDALQNICKNVQIRNVMEHKKGIVDDSLLKKLGCSQIEVLDDQGNKRQLSQEDLVSLSIPEISSFMSSIFVIQQVWRGGNNG